MNDESINQSIDYLLGSYECMYTVPFKGCVS